MPRSASRRRGSEPVAWSGWRCSGASSPDRPTEAGDRSSGPGHRRLNARHSSVDRRGLRRRSSPTRPGSSGVNRKRSTTVSLAGLLSWCSQRLPLRRRPHCVSTPSTLPSSTKRGAHRGEHAVGSLCQVLELGSHRASSLRSFFDSLASVSDSFGDGLPSLQPLATASLRAFGPRLPHLESCSALAVFHDFSGLRHTSGAGLLHPAADHGVRLVAGFRRGPCRQSCMHDLLLTHTLTRARSQMGPGLLVRACRLLRRWRTRKQASEEQGSHRMVLRPPRQAVPREHTVRHRWGERHHWGAATLRVSSGVDRLPLPSWPSSAEVRSFLRRGWRVPPKRTTG